MNTLNSNIELEIFYSASVRGFFMKHIHGDKMPKDVVSITKEQHEEIIAAQCEGMIIANTESGHPVMIKIPDMDEEDEKAAANASILSQIEILERDEQPRAMREFLIDNNKTRLEELNAKIADLRAQFQK
jgi:hypothetical protein